MNKTVLTSFTILCLLSTVFLMGLSLSIQPVKASGTITIRTDGSVDPPTAPISNVDDAIYTLTGNITSESNIGIMVYRDNIVIDGAGYTLQGKGAQGSMGISFFDLLQGRNNITIKNMEIKGFAIGVHLIVSTHAEICGNNITNNDWGILLGMSSDYNNISENTMTNNYEGILILDSSQNTVSENYITNCSHGINLHGAANNNIIGNNVSKNTVGIWLCSFSSSNSIIGNNITANSPSGISLYSSGSNNRIFLNNVSNNYCGIDLSRSSNNLIFHNIFVNNTAMVFPDPLGHYDENAWNDGYPSGGNYWSDYDGIDLYCGLYQNETGSDGIGDNPYIIAENNQDKYPLMSPIILLYYELLERYNELLSSYRSLNSTYHSLLTNYNDLLLDYTDLQSSYNQLNSSHITLQESYEELQSQQEVIIDELNTIRSLMFIFIAITVTFIATTVYFAIRKPKIKP